MHEDYQSEQPFHPARGFGGRAQMKANWGAILSGVPDLRAEVRASVRDGLVFSGRLFAELVEQGGVDINDSVQAQSGHRPRRRGLRLQD